MLNRGFFSLQSPWIPSWVAFGNLGLNALLDAVFYRFGIWGIPLSTSLVNIAGTAALLYFFRRRVGGFELGETARTFVLVCVASAVLAAVGWGVWHLLDSGLGRRCRPRSSRSAWGSCSASPPSSGCVGCWTCGSSRRCCACAAPGPDRGGQPPTSLDGAANPVAWVGR